MRCVIVNEVIERSFRFCIWGWCFKAGILVYRMWRVSRVSSWRYGWFRTVWARCLCPISRTCFWVSFDPLLLLLCSLHSVFLVNQAIASPVKSIHSVLCYCYYYFYNCLKVYFPSDSVRYYSYYWLGTVQMVTH